MTVSTSSLWIWISLVQCEKRTLLSKSYRILNTHTEFSISSLLCHQKCDQTFHQHFFCPFFCIVFISVCYDYNMVNDKVANRITQHSHSKWYGFFFAIWAYECPLQCKLYQLLWIDVISVRDGSYQSFLACSSSSSSSSWLKRIQTIYWERCIDFPLITSWFYR